MRKIRQTRSFKKDIKRISKQGKDLGKMYSIVEKLVHDTPLAKKNFVHKLTGNYSDKWECHIEPDWLLIYEIVDNVLVLYRSGSHSDLFT